MLMEWRFWSGIDTGSSMYESPGVVRANKPLVCSVEGRKRQNDLPTSTHARVLRVTDASAGALPVGAATDALRLQRSGPLQRTPAPAPLSVTVLVPATHACRL